MRAAAPMPHSQRMKDPFATALTSVDELRALYPPVLERAVRKDIGYLDDLCRRLIGGCSIAFRPLTRPRGAPT